MRHEGGTSQEMEELHRRVRAAVRRHCPPRLAQQAEDIAQEVLLKLHRSREKSAGKKSFSSMYLEKAVCGAIVDEIRRACRRKEEPVAEGPQWEPAAPGGADPEQSTSSAEIARGILDCLARLVPARRLAVTLYLHGCSVPEVAARRGWTLAKAESLVYRGRADLRACLKRKGLEP